MESLIRKSYKSLTEKRNPALEYYTTSKSSLLQDKKAIIHLLRNFFIFPFLTKPETSA